MQRQRFTVRGVLRGTYQGLEDDDASRVNRFFRISLAVGVLAGIVAFFTVVAADVLRTRLYGAGGVVLFVTVALFIVLSAAARLYDAATRPRLRRRRR